MFFALIAVTFLSHTSQISSRDTPEPFKFVISPVYLADTEKYLTVTLPGDEDDWTKSFPGAQNVGFLLAGHSEFPWLVDLRVLSTDQELWSIGNLFTADYVMTTCRVKSILEEAWKTDSIDRDDPGPVRVGYFRSFYFEYVGQTNFHPDKSDWPFGGTRKVEKYFTHPNCDLQKLKYDFALLKLERSIASASVYIGYMPYRSDPINADLFEDIAFSRVEARRVICNVGSVGKSYVDLKNHFVLNHKVSIRVYPEPFVRCRALLQWLCNSSRHGCEEAFLHPSVEGRQWECMMTRSTVAAVCDHDRGAPVVCDGNVVGLVMYGALFENCHNQIPLPFVVVKLHSFSEWSHNWRFYMLKSWKP